jgi:hypothetical protein
MSWIPAAIGAGTALVGGYLQNQAGKASAGRQMGFQEKMSNTAYQRGMADMRKAGLNPMLAYKMGGASSPTGAMYQPSNIGAAAVSGAQSVASAQQSISQSKQIDAQAAKVVQDTEFAKVLHDERWPRLFASMSAENVAASALAVMEGVSIEKVLAGQNHQLKEHERQNLKRFLLRVQGFKSIVGRELTGAGGVVADAVTGLKDKVRFMTDIIEEMYGELK